LAFLGAAGQKSAPNKKDREMPRPLATGANFGVKSNFKVLRFVHFDLRRRGKREESFEFEMFKVSSELRPVDARESYDRIAYLDGVDYY
jgi:hypothetical protein